GGCRGALGGRWLTAGRPVCRRRIGRRANGVGPGRGRKGNAMNGPTAAATAPKDTPRAKGAQEKGPIVWLDMDQQSLDDAYDQLVYAPNRDQLTKRRIANSAAARTRIGDPLRFAYG